MEWNDGGYRVMYWFEIFHLVAVNFSLPLNALSGKTSNKVDGDENDQGMMTDDHSMCRHLLRHLLMKMIRG